MKVFTLVIALANCGRPEPTRVTLAPIASERPKTATSDQDVCGTSGIQAIHPDEAGNVDRAAVEKAVDDAVAFADECCRGGATGKVRIAIDFPQTGWETAVSLTPSSFDEGDTGTCLHHTFQRIVVGAYRGDPMHIVRAVTLRP